MRYALGAAVVVGIGWASLVPPTALAMPVVKSMTVEAGVEKSAIGVANIDVIGAAGIRFLIPIILRPTATMFHPPPTHITRHKAMLHLRRQAVTMRPTPRNMAAAITPLRPPIRSGEAIADLLNCIWNT
jgi:hypothetical protein